MGDCTLGIGFLGLTGISDASSFYRGTDRLHCPGAEALIKFGVASCFWGDFSYNMQRTLVYVDARQARYPRSDDDEWREECFQESRVLRGSDVCRWRGRD